jgi:preprotein translocase subunit SecF
MRLFVNAKYDFIGARRTAYLVTAAFMAVGLIITALRGINYSVEFTGGTLMQITGQAPVDLATVRQRLAEQGISGAEIQTFGSNQEVVIRARTAVEGSDADNTQTTSAAVGRALDQVLGAGQYTIERTEAVGPKVGGELRGRALLAILLSFVAVLAYLAYRFEWRFGLAAVAATAHDVIATILFIGIFRLEVSLFVVAGVLSVLGYSLNDTIVIFDRIRENLHTSRREDFVALLNRSINETLPRTVLTGGTSIGSLLALALLGGEVVRPFALLMLFGVVIGTFSSIFIASPVLLEIEKRWPGADAKGVAVLKRKPQPAS